MTRQYFNSLGGLIASCMNFFLKGDETCIFGKALNFANIKVACISKHKVKLIQG